METLPRTWNPKIDLKPWFLVQKSSSYYNLEPEHLWIWNPTNVETWTQTLNPNLTPYTSDHSVISNPNLQILIWNPNRSSKPKDCLDPPTFVWNLTQFICCESKHKLLPSKKSFGARVHRSQLKSQRAVKTVPSARRRGSARAWKLWARWKRRKLFVVISLPSVCVGSVIRVPRPFL